MDKGDYEFDAAGRRLRSLAVPAAFLIAHPSAVISATFSCELPHIASMTCPNGTNTSGRQSNRDMEGLAITPDGTKLYGLMQSPLIQDGALNGSNARRAYAFAVDTALVSAFQAQALTPAVLAPGGGLKLDNKGRTPVAIRSTGLLDATAIEPSSVRVGGAPAALQGNGRPQCAVEDANGDGVADLVCHVETEQIVPQAGRVSLEASTDSGTPIRQWVPLR